MTRPKTGERFLHERDTALAQSREVSDVVEYVANAGEKIPNTPEARIQTYLGFLANKETVNDGIQTGDHKSLERQIDGALVTLDDVPESYWNLQKRIAREQGHGDIAITPELMQQEISMRRADQRASLKSWSDYLADEINQNTYPAWFKHWTWESVQKLGTYDKEKQKFGKRSPGTVAPFARHNAEALAYVYDAITHHIIEAEHTDNTDLQNLLQSGNFGKLYAYALHEVTPASQELRHITKGSWTKYDQIELHSESSGNINSQDATDPTALRLAESLQSHGTGWCTAGEGVATGQLQLGDFYVYYTQDADGNDTTPRIAIRMQGGRVAEVRGIESKQNLESNMLDIALEKINTLPGGDSYLRTADRMRRLTNIDDRAKLGEELTADDLLFLRYSGSLQGFGYGRDPRVSELLKGRNEEDDLDMILQVVDVDEFAGRLPSVKIANYLPRLIEAGATINTDELVSQLEPINIINNLPSLIEAGVDFNYIFSHLNEHMIINNLPKFIEAGANINIDEFVSHSPPYLIACFLPSIIKAGYDAAKAAVFLTDNGLLSSGSALAELKRAGVDLTSLATNYIDTTDLDKINENSLYELVAEGADRDHVRLILREKIEEYERANPRGLLHRLPRALSKAVKKRRTNRSDG